jgi:hypothetical protein
VRIALTVNSGLVLTAYHFSVEPQITMWGHFEPTIILRVRWYCRSQLSYRDLVEMMRERGLPVDRFACKVYLSPGTGKPHLSVTVNRVHPGPISY